MSTLLLDYTRERPKMVVESSTDSDEDVVSVKKERPSKRPTTTTAKRGMSLALTSGVFAALAGTFGKFAMNQTETLWICEQMTSVHLSYSRQQAYVICDKASWYIRSVAFVGMILVNAVMWRTFVKALRYCKSSLEATVTNTAANFFASAIVGHILFDESVSLMWWLGTLMIVFGLFLMNYGGNMAEGAKKHYRRRRKQKTR